MYESNLKTNLCYGLVLWVKRNHNYIKESMVQQVSSYSSESAMRLLVIMSQNEHFYSKSCQCKVWGVMRFLWTKQLSAADKTTCWHLEFPSCSLMLARALLSEHKISCSNSNGTCLIILLQSGLDSSRLPPVH